MTNNDFKKLLDNTVKPLQESLNTVKRDLNTVKRDLNTVKRDLEEVKDTQEERVLPAITYIETTVKSYADRYVINEDHIGRLDKRLNIVEEDLGIQPPEELKIPQLD